MEHRVRKKTKRNISYRYFIYIIIIIAILQVLALKTYYQEKTFKLPDNLFVSKTNFPISELTLDITHREILPENHDDNETASAGEDSEAETDESGDSAGSTSNNGLSEAQKNIALKALELLDEDVEYGYQLFPDTGYPDNNVWISTDLISITLNNCGYDLMELMYKDMIEHKEDYSLEDKGRKTPIKYIDFRDVIFQEKFFSRNALTTLPHEYNLNGENLDFLWQAGDIVYFRLDEDNHDKDRGGFISPHTRENGIPLVIMIEPETNILKEVDLLQEYEIIGHYRYPQPEVE